MGRRCWAAALAALGFVGFAHAQTLGRPAVDVGPALSPLPGAPLAPPAPVAPAPTAGVPVGRSTVPPAPLPRPVVAPGAQPAPVRVTNFADPPAVVIPTTPAGPPAAVPTGQAGSDPVAPLPGTAVGSPAAPTLPAPGTAPTTPGSSPASSGGAGGSASGPSETGTAPKDGGAAKKDDKKDADGVKFKFKPGDEHLLQMEYANGLFKFFVGGRLQIDAVWARAADNVQAPRANGGIGRVDDAVAFRRGRFDFGGTFYKNIDFLMEWDFINTFNAERTGDVLAANTPVPTDMWVTFKEVPVLGNVRVGNQKPPISFEHLTSSRFLNFMERSLAFDAFIENQNNGFEFGATAFDTYLDERGTWAVGVFKNTRSIFGWNVGDGEYDVTGRLTCLPVYENDGEYLLHLGLGASHRDFDDNIDRMRARTLIRNGPAVLHNIVTEVIAGGDSRDQVVPELVMVLGPWTFAAEYYRVWVHQAIFPAAGAGQTNYGTVHFDGAYAELLYFLTGEHRYYNRKTGAFGRVTPNANFRGCGDGCEDGCEEECGIGAWQVGVRYSWIDMNDKGIRGGMCHDVTVGLNWFLNPYMKWQCNYSALYRNAPNPANDGWVYGVGTRIALDF